MLLIVYHMRTVFPLEKSVRTSTAPAARLQVRNYKDDDDDVYGNYTNSKRVVVLRKQMARSRKNNTK